MQSLKYMTHYSYHPNPIQIYQSNSRLVSVLKGSYLILLFIYRERSAELKRKVCSWDFSPFGLTEQDLIHCVFLMFDQVLKLPELYHISITQGKRH